MDFNLSDEEQLLDDLARNFVEREYGFEKRREIMRSKTGWSRDIWSQLAELGLLSIGVPETYGGLDTGPVSTMLVMQSIGKGLLLEPFLASAVIVPALLRAIDDPAHEEQLFPAIANGSKVLTLADQEPGMRFDFSRVATRADRTAHGYLLNGRKSVVAHAETADAYLVTAKVPQSAEGELSLFLVPREAGGLTIKGYACLDGSRAADLELEDVELGTDARLGAEGRAAAALDTARATGAGAVCAEAVGIMEALLGVTAEYLRTRRQFGRPIGSFQALQHRAADMLIHLEQSKSMSYLATLRLDSNDPREKSRAISAAKVVVGRACRFVGQQAVQLHGGMGVTDELIVSHYFKRLSAIELAFGDAEHHLGKFIEHGLIPADEPA